jgi:hypothetical protein
VNDSSSDVDSTEVCPSRDENAFCSFLSADGQVVLGTKEILVAYCLFERPNEN